MAFDIIMPYQDLRFGNLVWDYIGSPDSTNQCGRFHIIQHFTRSGWTTEPCVKCRIFTKKKTTWLRNTALILTERIISFHGETGRLRTIFH